MRQSVLFFLLALSVSAARAQGDKASFSGDFMGEIVRDLNHIRQAQKNIEIADNPASKRAAIENKEQALDRLQTAADRRQGDPQAHIAVGKALASVDEAQRGIPYAERGLALAETRGDKKLIEAALTAAAGVYEKAGRYDLAAQKAKRALEMNPGNQEARMVYMTSKDRVAVGGPTTGRGAALDASAAEKTTHSGVSSPTPRDGGERRAGAALSDSSRLEADRLLAEGRRKAALDPAAALRAFDAAVKADPDGAAARLARAQARLAAGDAEGALADAEKAISLGAGAAALAARAEAKRALGRRVEEIAADYAAAAKLDPSRAGFYQDMAARAGTDMDRPRSAGDKALRDRRARAAARLVALTTAGLSLLMGALALLLLARRRKTRPPALFL